MFAGNDETVHERTPLNVSIGVGSNYKYHQIGYFSGVVILIISYIFVFPGQIALMLRSEISLTSMFTNVGIDITTAFSRSMFGTVDFLWNDGYRGLAVLLTFFSILMPWFKLAGIVYVLWKPPATVVLKVVQRISKWAMMDIVVTITIVAALGDIFFLDVTLHIGFYCFLTYCILSVAGVLLLEPQYETEQANWSVWRILIAIALDVVGLCILGVLFIQPIIHCYWFPFIDMELTIFDIIQKLWRNGFYCPSIVMGAAVVVLPALDVLISSARGCGLPVNQLMIQWIEDFQMLDVFSLGLVITVLSLKAEEGELEVNATPQLYILLTVSLLWLVLTLTLHEGWRKGAYLGKAG